jgi:hypothetical protein
MKYETIAVVTGAVLAGGWWAFLDGVVYSPDTLPWYHLIPPVLATVAFVCLNLVSQGQVKELRSARVWIFVWLTVACMAIGAAIWITVAEYPPDIGANWPGVSIVVQTSVTLMIAFLFFLARPVGEFEYFQE